MVTNKFEEIGTEHGKLVAAKNIAYGSAFQQSAALLKLFYPNGIKPEQFVDALLTTRICDKLFRNANKKEAFGESPFSDIVGYGILGVYQDRINAIVEETEQSLGSALHRPQLPME